jgi:uncharacterized protein YjiS (DUF1127 family)
MTYLTYQDVGRKAPARPGLAAFKRLVHTLREAVSTWRSRRDSRDAFVNLLHQDDRILADIGVLRDEVEWAARLPLAVDAATALRDTAAARRRAEERARAPRRRHDARHLDAVYAGEVRRLGVPR